MPPPPRDLDTWMWAEACETLARAERLQRHFFQLGPPGPRISWEPPVDIFETGQELWIVAALPGVEPRQVEISIASGIVTITGERPAPPVQQRATVHRMEIPQGRFERRIALPPGHFELGRRDLVNGCLTLTLRQRG